MDLDGNVGTPTCHACGGLAGSASTLGDPCCVSKDDGTPFCVSQNMQCATFVEGDEGFAEGIMGECECIEIATVTDEGGCVGACGQCEGCDCCNPVDGCALFSFPSPFPYSQSCLRSLPCGALETCARKPPAV